MKVVLLSVLFLGFSQYAYAVDSICSIPENSKIEAEFIELSTGTAIDLMFPGSEEAELDYVRLWYGNENELELLVQLDYDKVQGGYISKVIIGEKHSLVKVLASYKLTYKWGVCPVELRAVIENGNIRNIPNP